MDSSKPKQAKPTDKWASVTSKPKPGAHHQNVIKLTPHSALFLENDVASALYIIKRGAIRLFKPKKEGQIELAVLHEGEVIGEMAFFDAGSRRRSCSAEALVTTELIEITFEAFDKVINNISPWFKTIVNTLVDRLIRANAQIKKFEDSSVALSYGKGGGAPSFVFFKDDELAKFFGIFYLMSKEKQEGNEAVIPAKVAEYYAQDVFCFSESKNLEFENLLVDLNIADLVHDEQGKLQDIKVKNLDLLKKSFVSFNKQRLSSVEEIKMSEGAVLLLEGILLKHNQVAYTVNNPTVNVQSIVDNIMAQNIKFDVDEFAPIIQMKLIEEPSLDAENNFVCRVDLKKIEEQLPMIKINQSLESLNEEKRKKR